MCRRRRAACQCPSTRPTWSATRSVVAASARRTSTGNPRSRFEAEGLRVGTAFQHEIDHLDGILFIDRISRLKRSLYVKKRKKQIAAED